LAFCNSDCFFAYPVSKAGKPCIEWQPGASFSLLKDWVKDTFGDPHPSESDYQPGTAYKRIYWPLTSGSYYRAIDQGKRTQSFVALRILLDKLGVIFQTIEPSKKNHATFGHLVRELLLLACMEVESSWAAVLKENGYLKPRLTTEDYVKLKEAMVLDCYRLSLQSYPDFPNFAPFENWDTSAPTESLIWYEAYNKTKHDREQNLEYASLENAIHAVGAAVVMFYAQFGNEIESHPREQPALVISNSFSLETDYSRHEQSWYIPELKVSADPFPTPIPSFDWKLVNYPF